MQKLHTTFYNLIYSFFFPRHDTQQTVNGSVSATARDIQRLGVVVRRGDKPQKLQVERLTQAFRDALAKYSSVQKVGFIKLQNVNM